MSCAYQEQPPKKPLLAYASIILILILIVLWGSGCNTVKGSSSSEVKDKDSTTTDLQEWFNKLSSDSTVTQNDNGSYFKAYIWQGGSIGVITPAIITDSSTNPLYRGIHPVWNYNVHDTVVPFGYSYFEKGTYNRDKKTSVKKTQDEHYKVYHHFNITTHYAITETKKDNSRTAWWLPILFISIVAMAGLYLFNKFSNPILSFIKELK
jgi:hypothetical protein